jgi:hypothetical protein
MVRQTDMGRITIFNPISALIVGAMGAAIGVPFGREGIRWGALIGGLSGFIFPFYPVVLVANIVRRFRRGRDKCQPVKRDEDLH